MPTVCCSLLSHLKGCVASSKVHRQHNDRMRKAGAGAVAVRHARLEEEEPTNAGGDFSAANGSHLFSIESPTSQDGPGVCVCCAVCLLSLTRVLLWNQSRPLQLWHMTVILSMALQTAHIVMLKQQQVHQLQLRPNK